MKIVYKKTKEIDDDNMIHGKNYAFFHRPLNATIGPQWYLRVVGEATRSIDIWDPYFNQDTNNDDSRLFNYVKHPVKIKFLMAKSAVTFINAFNSWENTISSYFPKGLKVGSEVELGYIDDNGSDVLNSKWKCHDRFLIVDEKRMFLVGSSLGYHLRSINSTGMYELQDKEDKDIVKEMFGKYWQFAQSHNQVKTVTL